MAEVFCCVSPDLNHLVIVKTSADTRAKWFFELLQLRPLATLKHTRVQPRAADLWINNDSGLFLGRHFLAMDVSAAETVQVRVIWARISAFKSNSRTWRQTRSWKTL